MNALEQWEFYFYWILLPIFTLISIVAVTMIWPNWFNKLCGFIDRESDYEADDNTDWKDRHG